MTSFYYLILFISILISFHSNILIVNSTSSPTIKPTTKPSIKPTNSPSTSPTLIPTARPTIPTTDSSKCVLSGITYSGNVNCVGGDIFLRGQYIEVGIHNVGSYGTSVGAPSGFVSAGRQLGFIADFDKNGFTTTSPGYAGDYFVPGAPVEGWIIQWKNSGGDISRYQMEGLMGNYGIIPTTFQITSTPAIQSAMWVGKAGPLEVTKVTQFKNSDVYFTTTVTLKNTGTTTLSNLYYMRTVDPDQEQPYYGWFPTLNYVQYQPAAADGSDCCLGKSYVNPTNPNTALVIAVGINNENFVCGLGTINSNARVSHWGFYESDAAYAYADGSGSRLWTYYGGNDMFPDHDYSSRMRWADEAIHLVFKYLSLAPGETVQLSYAYVLRTSDLYDAMASIGAVTITQPTSDISGKNAIISVAIRNLTVNSVRYFVYGVKSSVSTTPAFYQVGTILAPTTTYAITFDSTVFNDGDIQIQISVNSNQGDFPAFKAARISNAGVVMAYTISDNSGTYPFSNTKLTTLNLTVTNPEAGNPDSISFYREYYSSGQVLSVSIGKVTKAPWSIRVSCSDLAIGTPVSIKASVSSYSGRYTTSTIFSGIVSFTNSRPSDIILTLSSTILNENSAIGTVVGVFNTIDVDVGQSYIYTLLDSAGGKFSIAGSALTVAGNIDYETTKTLTVLIRTNDGQVTSCCLDKSFTITIGDVNEAPTNLTPLTITTPENVATGTILTTFITTDPDVGQSFRYSLNVPSTTTSLSTTGILSVIGTIDYETQSLFTLLVRTTDNGSPNLYLDSIVTIYVTNVNEAPTSIILSCNPCIVPENTPKGTIIGTLSTIDPDIGDTFTYSSTSTSPTTEIFAISSTGIITVQNTISYRSTGGSVTLSIKSRDIGGLFLISTSTIIIKSVPSAPSSSSITCYCDENLMIGNIVSSKTRTTPAFCQISASTNNNAQLDYQIVSNHGINGNYNGAFDIQSCSGILLVNKTLDYETYNFYNLTIKITSPGGITYSKAYIYLVNVNEAPILSSATYTVNENSNIGTIITSSLTSKTYDQDDIDPISASKFCCSKVYTITSGNSDGYFSITSSNGAITVAKNGLNYEAKNSYTIGITITDAGGLTSTANMIINILDINESPILPSSSGTYGSINENSKKGTKVGSSIVPIDPDIGQSITLTITSGNINNAFNLTSIYDSSNGIRSYYFTLHGIIDYETLNIYNMIITATDNGIPSLSTTGTYTIRINDVNEPPTLPSTLSFSLNENSPRFTTVGTTLKSYYSDPDIGSTATFSISSYGTDTGKNFNIDSLTGQIYFDNTILSYEKTPLFNYIFRVTDNGGLFASCSVTIHINNLPEAPIFSSFITGYVTENIIGQYIRASNQDVLYTASDDDGDHLNFTIKSVNGLKTKTETNRFKIIPVGVTSTKLYTTSSFNYETLKDYTVLLQVTDHVYNVSKSLTVSVIDANDAPTVLSTQNCYVAQNALKGTSICNIIGIDEDTTILWNTLTYSLVNPISGLNVSTLNNIGILYLTSDNTRLPNTIVNSINVRVKDGGGLSAIQVITLTITPVNFPPACPTTSFLFSVNENTVSNTLISKLTGTNTATTITDTSPTGVTLSCSISSGNNDGKFLITSDCNLKTTSNLLDYEVKNLYSLTILVTENTASPLSNSCPVTIQVIDVNEPTTLNDQIFYTDENIPSGVLTANSISLSPVIVIDQDPADQNGIFTFVCISCGNDPISINPTTGMLSLKSGFSLNYETLKVYTYQCNWNSRGVSKSSIITININNLPEAPIATSTTFTVNENFIGIIGYVNVIDPDFVGIVDFTNGNYCKDLCGLKYTVTSTTSGSLLIDSNTGAISIISPSIDYEDYDIHTISITIKDSTNLISSCDITILVNDVNDCSVTTITDINGNIITTGNTQGGTQVLINGRNFGPTKHRMSISSISSSSIIASASLQSSSTTSLSTYVFSMKCSIYRSTLYDNTLLNCTLPEGVGKNLGVIVTISAKYGSTTKTCTTSFSSTYLSYNIPILNEIINGMLIPTIGGTTVTLQGLNFGPKGVTYNNVIGTVFNTYFTANVGCTVTKSHIEITCNTVSGIGSTVSWTIRVGGQTSLILTDYSSYALPTITSITTLSDLNTVGGETIQIIGTNFGEFITYIQVTYGTITGTEYLTSCIFDTKQTILKCTSSPGIGKLMKFYVKIGDQTSTLYTSTIKYKLPILSSISGSGSISASTEGGDIFYLTGTQFGPITSTSSPSSNNDIIVTYGKTGIEFIAEDCKVITSHTKVQCLTSPGTGINHKFYIYIGGQQSLILLTNASYGSPTISGFSGEGAEQALARGYQTIYVTGTNFGPSMSTINRVYYSELNGTIFDATSNCTMYTLHRVLKCKTLPGAGKRLTWNVIVDNQISVTPMTSYSPPIINTLIGKNVNNASVSGGDIITLIGENFGPSNAYELYGHSFLDQVTYGSSGSEYKASNCMVISDSEITCKTVAGVGGLLRWEVTIGGQTSELSSITMSYASPFILSMIPNIGTTDGTVKVTLTGLNFAVETLPKLYFGGKRITSFSEKENEIQFFVPIAISVTSIYYPVYIEVGGQLSNVVNFQYSTPIITSINSIDNGNNTILLSILGSSFSLSPIVTIIPSDSLTPISPYCSKKQHNEIICTISIRAGNVTVHTDVAVSNNMYFRFGEPLLISSSLSSGQALTTGYTLQNLAQLYIIGQYFGVTSSDIEVIIENSIDLSINKCEIISYQYVSKTTNLEEWNRIANQIQGLIYHTDDDFQYLTCNLPSGQGKLNSLRIVRGTSYSLGCGCELCTKSTCFSYLPPTITSITPSIGSTEGSYPVIIRGTNFGYERIVKIDNIEWMVDTLKSNDTVLIINSVSGEGKNKKIMIQVGNQNTSNTNIKYFSYAIPIINPLLSTLIVGTNGTLSPITITGSNFGIYGPIVYLNKNINLISFTHTSLTFNIPPGQGKGFKLLVNVSNQIGYSPDIFSYTPPHITSANPLNCVTNGGRQVGLIVTLLGSNFGFQNLDWKLTIGNFEVLNEDIIHYDQNKIQFYPPPGQGKNLLLTLIVGEQSYTGGPFYFNYDPPTILSLETPDNKDTAGGYTVSFNGLSFGTSGLQIYLYDPLYYSTTSLPLSSKKILKLTSQITPLLSDIEYFYRLLQDKEIVEDNEELHKENKENIIKSINLINSIDLSNNELHPYFTISSASSFRMPLTLCKVIYQSHSLAKCTVPPGVGNNLIFSFNVDGQTTHTNFSYSPPIVDYFSTSNGGDASGGESLKVYGRNFGAFRTPLNITIGNVLCLNSVWLADDPIYNYEPYLKCTTPPLLVGPTNVTVYVAYQDSLPNPRYSVECKSGAFGGIGEYCTDCGDPALTGLLCEYDNMYWPIAATGWYMSILSTPNTECPEATQNRETCPAVLPCLPSQSCLGNNTCSTGYIGDRCATCDEGYYRINGRCEVCPNNPWLIFVVLFLCGSTAVYIAYKLAQKNVNLGILSIGIDYFQVLAVFGSADVKWPPALVDMYNSFSVFNFNVDFLAPDCWSNASLPFKTKWIGITLSPIGILFIISIFYLGYVTYLRIFKPQIKNHSEMLYKCFAFYLMAFYYGYLMLSNNTLAIFNCQPTDPSDGHRYMAEVGPDGGICYEPGSVQQQLEPWAIIAFIVYTIGFPAYVAFVLYTHNESCIYVQVMKAAGKSEGTEYEKQTLTRFKTLYNRLFYQFKPEYYYWVFCILVRKFFLSVSAVIFRENVVFLLALYMLILFISYTAQVTHQPYMSTSEYEEIAEKYSDVISMYVRENKTIKSKGQKTINRLGEIGPMFKLEAPKIEFFNNYNTVESTLLFSAIVVSISAIMFESNELTGAQRDALAYLVILVVAVSLSYFFWILFTELWVAFYPTVPLLCIKPKKEQQQLDTDIEFADVSYERQNPIIDAAEKERELTRLQTQLETAESMITQMQSEIGTLKKQRKTENLVSTGAPTVAIKKQKKKAMLSYNDNDEDENHAFVEMK